MLTEATARQLVDLAVGRLGPDKEAYLAQLEGLEYSVADAGGSFKLVPTGGFPVPDGQGVLMDGAILDIDVIEAYVLLHAHQGWLSWLEIYRADGADLKGDIDPSKVEWWQ